MTTKLDTTRLALSYAHDTEPMSPVNRLNAEIAAAEAVIRELESQQAELVECLRELIPMADIQSKEDAAIRDKARALLQRIEQ